MAGNSFGTLFRITTWGESHGEAIGVTIDGCPAGLDLKPEEIQKEVDRRRVGQSAIVSQRKEPDRVEILSGVFEGKTTGAPISILIRNVDARSKDYESIKNLFRPGHADYTYFAKYGHRDHRGGGRSSARETACRVAAGAVAKKILAREGIDVFAHTVQIEKVTAKTFRRDQIEKNDVRCADPAAAEKMRRKILAARKRGDSVGGIIEVRATGVPAGLGDPVYDKLDADLAKALMGINAVKGVEIGEGFHSAVLTGSTSNDGMRVEKGKIRFTSNRAGGIVGGISNGNDVVARIAVKPTSSISIPQESISVQKKNVTIRTEGRHDPCICPRAVPIAEAMTALVLVDHLFRNRHARI
jgi:chorismate synthase